MKNRVNPLGRHILCVALVLMLGACASANRPLQLISGQGPVYPPGAQSQGIEGLVVIRYDVNVAGMVENARVVRSDPAGLFDDAALAAVRSWRFNAPIMAGEAQPALNRESSVQFRLNGAQAYDQY